jgi:hypothetical protein
MLVNASAEIRKAAGSPLAAGLGPIHPRTRRTTAWDYEHTCRRRSFLRIRLCPPIFPGYPAQKLFSYPNPTRETTASAPRTQTMRDRCCQPGSGIGSTSVAKVDSLRGGGKNHHDRRDRSRINSGRTEQGGTRPAGATAAYPGPSVSGRATTAAPASWSMPSRRGRSGSKPSTAHQKQRRRTHPPKSDRLTTGGRDRSPPFRKALGSVGRGVESRGGAVG